MLNCLWKHRVYTSTAYRYSQENWSEDENILAYGADASTSGVGYNLVVEAKLDSNIVSEADFRTRLYDTSRLIDHKFLNQDLEYFKTGPVTLERIAVFIREKLDIPSAQVRVTESRRCSVETLPGDELVVTLFDQLSSVHRHWNPALSDAENVELYGKCSSMHGHQYNIEVSLRSRPDPESGLAVKRDEMQRIIKEKLVTPLDGSFLNEHLGNTSGEKIAIQLMERLEKCLEKQHFHRIVLRETRKNSFKVGAALF